MNESCESKVPNILASMNNLPKKDIIGKLDLLSQAIEEQEKEIKELQKRFST